MKNRISSIMDTSKRKAGAAILCGAIILTMGTGIAFAANANTPVKDNEPTITINDGTILNNTNGTIKRSEDGGDTWKPFVYEAPNLERYSVAEYEQLVKDFKAAAPGLVASGYYTQDEADKAIAVMEENLALLKADNGRGLFDVYKPVKENTWEDENGDIWNSTILVTSDFSNAVFSSNSDVYTSNDLKTAEVFPNNDIPMLRDFSNAEFSKGYGGVLDFGNGNVIDIGRFNTEEEALSAVKAYCDAEVKAGRISQAEADRIIIDFKQ